MQSTNSENGSPYLHACHFHYIFRKYVCVYIYIYILLLLLLLLLLTLYLLNIYKHVCVFRYTQ